MTEDAVIGAGAVFERDVEPYTLVTGMPPKPGRQLEQSRRL